MSPLQPELNLTGVADVLAQSLSALYLTDSDKKRWGDGVLARKKGLGL